MGYRLGGGVLRKCFSRLYRTTGHSRMPITNTAMNRCALGVAIPKSAADLSYISLNLALHIMAVITPTRTYRRSQKVKGNVGIGRVFKVVGADIEPAYFRSSANHLRLHSLCYPTDVTAPRRVTHALNVLRPMIVGKCK